MLRNRWVRRLILLIAVGFLFIIGTVICQSVGYHQTAMSSPESTVKGALTAYETEEPAKVIAYFTPLYGSNMKENLKRLFAACDSISIENIDTMVIYEEGLAAQVQASWDMGMEVAGRFSTQHFAKTIRLVKEDKKWHINQVI